MGSSSRTPNKPRASPRFPLRGVTVVLMFIENSTRTRMSFEVAAKRLADVDALEALLLGRFKDLEEEIHQRDLAGQLILVAHGLLEAAIFDLGGEHFAWRQGSISLQRLGA